MKKSNVSFMGQSKALSIDFPNISEGFSFEL
jgi:hypothetical protein